MHREDSLAKNKNGVIYLIAIIPFLLNDLSNIFFISYERWLIIDYLCRILALVFIGACLNRHKLTLNDLYLNFERKDRLTYWTLFLSVFCLGYYVVSYLYLLPIIPHTSFANVVLDKGSLLHGFDLYFGLMLVAISEEVIFRGLAYSALQQAGCNTLGIVAISSTLFSLIHWSTGPMGMIDCFFYGAAFMVVTMRTKSIVPATIVHYALDYWYYV